MRRKAGAALLALLLFGTACSSGDDATDSPGSDPKTAQEDGTNGKAGGKKDGKGKGKNGRRGGKNGNGRGGKDGKGSDDDLPGAPGSATVPGSDTEENAPGLDPQGEGGPAFASKSAHFEEPGADAEKDGPLSPGYAEATEIDVEGLGDDVRITFTFAGEVPQKMPTDKTYMVVAFGFSAKKKGQEGYGMNAQASNEGWQVVLGSKDQAKEFPGTFFVRGNTVEFTLPWSAVGGPRPFEFYASSSWFQYAAGVTSYSVDPIPNDKGTYPN